MFNIDIAIFAIVITATLIIGFMSSRGITTIRGYALGDRNFSTGHIVATIVATWVSGEFFVTTATESYSAGLFFIVFVVFANFLCTLIIAFCFAPRLGEFLDSISIAEAMGKLYGRHVRTITSVAGFIGVAAIIAIQLQIAGLVCNYLFNVETIYGVLFAGITITLYSSLGGIKSVTFTDVMQFITFCVTIPFVLYIMIKNSDQDNTIIDTINTNPLFDYKTLFSFSNPQIYYYISLFVWLIIPGFNPAIFQRISMARNTKQVRDSFIMAAFICFTLALLVCVIGVLVLTHYPDLKSEELLKTILIDYSWISGFKGLLFAGIIAMVMSTVDSYINSSSILLIHDLRASLRLKPIKNELLSTRIAAFLIGIISILFALREGNFFALMLWSSVFYMPIVTVPFLMTLFGFRSSGRSVLAGMFAGFVVVVFWELFLTEKMPNVGHSALAAMLANLITLFAYHYLFNQPGGWVGIKNQKQLENKKKDNRRRAIKFFNSILDFKYLAIIFKCLTPRDNGTIFSIGIFIIFSGFASVDTLGSNILGRFGFMIDLFYPIVLVNAAILISYPVWSKRIRNSVILDYCWYFTVFFSLSSFSFVNLIISNFNAIQIVVVILNLILIAIITNWHITLLATIFSLCMGLVAYNKCVDIADVTNSYSLLSVKIIYLLLMLGGIILVFLRPKQNKAQLIKERNEYLNCKVQEQREEVAKADEMKKEFIRNIQHEANTPMAVVQGHLEVLHSCYDVFPEEERKKMLAEARNESSKFLLYADNMNVLAQISKDKIVLEKEDINLSEIIYELIDSNKKLHIEDEDDYNRIWDVDIADDIIVNCDKKHISKAISNLIENAIKYCPKGEITITLKKDMSNVRFTITDQGCGVPEEDLQNIFEPFVTSSITRERSGGKGIGLTVTKKIIEMHNGKIDVYNNEVRKETMFHFVLPRS